MDEELVLGITTETKLLRTENTPGLPRIAANFEPVDFFPLVGVGSRISSASNKLLLPFAC
jgi:hypothetical protein